MSKLSSHLQENQAQALARVDCLTRCFKRNFGYDYVTIDVTFMLHIVYIAVYLPHLLHDIVSALLNESFVCGRRIMQRIEHAEINASPRACSCAFPTATWMDRAQSTIWAYLLL